MKPNTVSNTIKISEVIGAEKGKITAINTQKKNSYRYSIFVNNIFLMGISEATFAEFDLIIGSLVDQPKIDRISSYEQKAQGREYLFKLLSRRDHSSKELLDKARLKGFPSNHIQESITELEQKGYINNHSFAKKFANDKFKFNNWGKQKIKIELIKKGISDHTITDVLAQFDDDEMVEKMEKLVIKARARILRTDPNKRKKKIFDFLMRKGYDPSLIQAHMHQFLNQIEQ